MRAVQSNMYWRSDRQKGNKRLHNSSLESRTAYSFAWKGHFLSCALLHLFDDWPLTAAHCICQSEKTDVTSKRSPNASQRLFLQFWRNRQQQTAVIFLNLLKYCFKRHYWFSLLMCFPLKIKSVSKQCLYDSPMARKWKNVRIATVQQRSGKLPAKHEKITFIWIPLKFKTFHLFHWKETNP